MSTRLALDLDHDAIRLLSQQSDGWVVEGVAELGSADLNQKIAGLRQRAGDLAGPDPAVLLVLPRSQVLYTSFEGLEDPEGDVAERLDGLTPYDLSEITWDQATSDGSTHVAAVALETLDEALAFAASIRFRVVGLTSEPPEGEFPRLPVFQRLPAFLRGAEAERPLVLEPDRPPERAAVAFSHQRGAEYGPGRAPPTVAAAVRTRKAAMSLPTRLGTLLAGIPKPLLGAAAIGGAVILGAALWPEGDPDPFTKRNFDLSFTEVRPAAPDGFLPPASGEAPATPATTSPVTLLRDAPAILVPVVIGASGVDAGSSVAASPQEAFERLAALPALYGETRLPAMENGRPAVLSRPAFPAAEAPGVSLVARVAAPAFPPPPPAVALEAADPAPVVARELARLPVALPGAPAPSRPPQGLSPPEPPLLLSEAPATRAAPVETGAPGLLPAPLLAPTADKMAETVPLPAPADLVAALPDAAMALLPPPAGQPFDIGPDGFVVATPEGAETPGGVLAIAGAPPVVAPPRPGSAERTEEVAVADEVATADETAAAEEVEVTRANPNPELAAFLPRARPGSAVAEVVDAGPAASISDDLIAEALAAPAVEEPDEPVLTVSLVPRPRPERSAAPVQTATRAAPAAPRIPSRANVAREATMEDALPLAQLNLIGVYGSASNRRALVRLPSGRFVKLKVGDRIDGGQVAQIGTDRLLYQKGSRTLALEMPNT